ncbi:MAG: hypothetical protein II518_02070, partial [Candidatus Methanomethylophilus sp.]|nr:hypothetical protein [Methanomethylophilus sp.]
IKTKKWKYGEPDRNEVERRLRRIRHKYDFVAWAFFTIKIRHKKLKRRVRFVLNLPQLTAFAKCEELRARKVPISLIILKARQWGGSTFCFFYQVWLMFKWNEFHSFAIAAHTSSASETILTMLRRAIKDYPAWDLGLPDGTELRLAPADNTGHAFAIKDQDNKQVLEGFIYLGTAEKPDTLRSKDINGAHYSEVGLWPDTDAKKSDDIIADIEGGMTDDEDTMRVMESTAKFPDDFFAETWKSCNGGRGGYAQVFVPSRDIVFDTRPIDDLEEFAKWLIEHKDDDSPNGIWKDSGKYYWWLWEVGSTLEHIQWYRHRRLRITFAKMCNEAPETPEQAFFTAGNHVFDPFQVQAKEQLCRDPQLVGDLVAEGDKGADALKDIRFIPNSTGDLRIWEEPDDSPVKDRYVVVLDPRRGASDGADPACITVFDRLLMMPDFGLNGRPGVVAEMNYKGDPDKQAYDAARLAEWYGHALLVIESNTMEAMDAERNNGIDSFEYIMDIVSKIYDHLYMRKASEADMKKGITFRWGFHTNPSTKPKIINFMKECLRDDLWDEPSNLCCSEMASYMEDHGKTNAEHGKHDDVVMSRAIGLWICYKELPPPAWIKKETKPGKEIIRGDESGLTNI